MTHFCSIMTIILELFSFTFSTVLLNERLQISLPVLILTRRTFLGEESAVLPLATTATRLVTYNILTIDIEPQWSS